MWKKKMLEALQSCSGPDWPPGESCTKKKREKKHMAATVFFCNCRPLARTYRTTSM